MDDPTRLVFEQLGISLVLGLLVGLQRQRSEPLIAGLRTFPLITVFGTVAAMLDKLTAAGGWIVAAGLLALVGLVVASYIFRFQRDQSGLGMTTEAAIFLMYLLGAYIVFGDRIVAIAVGAGVAVLLQFKPELHGIASRLADDDVRAIMTFVLITCIMAVGRMLSEDFPPEVESAEPADVVEASWARTGNPPDLGELLADHPHWSPRELRAALLVDQQFRGRSGWRFGWS